MMKVKVKIYDLCKYDVNSKKVEEVEYEIESFKVLSNLEDDNMLMKDEIDKIESMLDEFDEHHEYLVLYLQNGETATFRNSHVDMFMI